ncbi:glycogen debranching protein GlgX [Gemmata sp. JC717]|uniref:Glycogen debranching protein GlgX n=1 Tax=Gemmata algarum TaxID=2975278 RepID=A0ABU5EZA2_9BACT|nr:glycogen debranching protein GlgX [Gemmata algarum]MDY3552588.1 glycogen debranching protein GlgX [Gemmata algarum]MDY3559817.1 glycogen debranching protein GlgX [Gemmata algarum]
MMPFRTSRGRPLPLGPTLTPDGANFALLCRHGQRVTLVILPAEGGSAPLAELPLDARLNRTGDHWHIRVHDLPEAFCYGWRVDGPRGPRTRFDPNRLLLDPACAMLSEGAVWAGTCETDPQRTSRRSLFRRGTRYNWEEDVPPLIEYEDSIIYEVHVRGFTCHPSSGVQFPGTFKGLVEKIPYLKWLGVTAVELMPVFEWDECDCPFFNPDTGEKLVNFWGYNPVALAAPKAAFAATANRFGQTHEFRDMVKAMHAAGIEVILDVVFNHTGEGNDQGRTYSFRGLDNELYYLLDPQGRYLNYSGCGNTVNCNHPVVRDLIMTCLRYWAADMHVDGFRFDLASILGRDRSGNVMVEPPVIESITEDGVLADTKLIAEPWDAGGLYQVGRFPFGRRWSEWNGKYRDDVRRFWKGDYGLAPAMAERVCGSADLYQWSGRLPRHSVNFVTAHDGFTLNDLVSYNEKHNHANGEGNRDGESHNSSWNCGAEGPTDDPEVLALRRRQARNMMTTLMLSQGVPMLLAGDEFLRTQQGNNNAWCQDNEISWVDWGLAEENKDFLRFVRELIHLRKRHPVLRRRRFFVGELLRGEPAGLAGAEAFPPGGPVRPGDAGLSPGEAGEFARATRPAGAGGTPLLADIHWHGTEPYQPDWGGTARTLAFALDGRFTGREHDRDYHIDNDFYVALNAWSEPLAFRIPPAPTRRRWRRLVDTARPAPEDIIETEKGPPVADGSAYTLAPFSALVLISEG